MSLENLNENIEHEKKILKEITKLIGLNSGKEKAMVDKTISSLIEQLKIINNSLPGIIESVSPVKSLSNKEEPVKALVNIRIKDGTSEKAITLNESDRRRFFDELSLSNSAMKKMKEERERKVISEFKKPSQFAKNANRLFSGYSNNLVEKGYFKSLSSDLRKANMPFVLNTYVSIILFSTFLAAVFSIALFVFLLFFSFNMDSLIAPASGFGVERILLNIVICLVIPAIIFAFAYVYPSAQKNSIKKKIDQELPFAAMHMSAIAGSGIEPSQIFMIVVLGKEYPYIRQEIKKVINQVNVYGYDLVNALRNSAASTSSQKMAELFNGFATTISSGGKLTDFLDKRSETLLFDYKLEREKGTKMAETFMDMYISIVIAAPMIMMLLLVLITVSNISIGLTLDTLTFIIISIVALINIVFLGVLQIKKQTY